MSGSLLFSPSVNQVLGNSPLFSGVDLSSAVVDMQAWPIRDIPAGQILLSPLRDNTELLILLEGEWVVTMTANSSRPIARITPGGCVGELSILDSQRPSSHVMVTQDSRYLVIQRDALWSFITSYPVVALNLLRVMADRTREKSALLESSLGLLHEYRMRAETDTLTGLHNRNWLMEIFPQQLDLSLRIGHPVSLMLIDVDFFKKVNDTYGHTVGDQVLQHLAAIMQGNLRSTDLLARYGGEEFAVMMPATHVNKARASAERLRRRIYESPLPLADNEAITLSISIGVAECLPGWGLDDFLKASDQALYVAKNNGRNQVQCWKNPF
ncbi:MAG: GGDEF domain-containing protein [Methylovulum sp.]|nr:MAG: GGDEF domain-containing protein [Methylovulum sp.]